MWARTWYRKGIFWKAEKTKKAIVDKLHGSIYKNWFHLSQNRDWLVYINVLKRRKCGELLTDIPKQERTLSIVQVVRLHPNSFNSQNIAQKYSPRHMEFLCH